MSGRYGSDGRLQIDVPAASIINASGILAFSAGTQSTSSGTVTFADSNGFVFGLSNGVLTASVTGVTAAANINISAGTTSNNLSAVTFSNANHVSFGINNSTVTASYALEVAAGTATGTAANSLSALSFADSNGVSWGVSNGTITASMAGGGGNSSWTASDSATSLTIGQLAFSTNNGVTLGLSTTTGGSATVTLTHGLQFTSNTSNITSNALNTSASRVINIVAATNNTGGGTASLSSNVQFSSANGITFYTSAGNAIVASYTVPTVTNSSWTASDSATSLTIGRLAFTGSNGITMNLLTTTGGLATLTATYTVPTVTNSSWTASDSATSLTIARLAFGTANGMTLSLSTTTGGSATLNGSYTVPSTAGLISAIKISAGLSSSNVSAVTFSDANNVTWGYDGTNVTASVATGNRVGVNGAFATQVNRNFLNSNNVSFGYNGVASSQVTASYELDLSAGTSSAGINALTVSDSNGMAFGLNGSTLTANVNLTSSNGVAWGTTGNSITANVGYISYYENMPLFAGTVTQALGNSTLGVVPFNLPLAGSFSYLRVPLTMSSNSTSFASTNTGTAFSGSLFSTHYVVIYSLGTGGSSRSLQSVTSGSAGFSEQLSFSVSGGAAAGTRWSVTYKVTCPFEGATTNNFSTTTAASSTRYDIGTNNDLGGFNNGRVLDIPLAASLTAGAYWLGFGMSSTSSTQSIAALTGARIDYSYLVASQVNVQLFAPDGFGGNFAPQIGLGTFSTNAMTTGSIALANISTIASYPRLFFQMIRQA